MDQLLLPSKAEFIKKLSTTRCSTKERRRISLVYNFSLRHHRESPRRASGEHYFWHIYRATMQLLDDFIKFDIWNAKLVEILLLHDVIEDARESNFDPALVYRKVIKSFGNELAYGTLAMTKRKGEHSDDALARLVHEPYWLALIDKIYDREDNLRTLRGMPVEKQARKLAETEMYFPVIFTRLQAEISMRVRSGHMSENWLLLLNQLHRRHLHLVATNKRRLEKLSQP